MSTWKDYITRGCNDDIDGRDTIHASGTAADSSKILVHNVSLTLAFGERDAL